MFKSGCVILDDTPAFFYKLNFIGIIHNLLTSIFVVLQKYYGKSTF